MGVVALKEVRQAIEGERFLDASHVDAEGEGRSGSFTSPRAQDTMLKRCPEPSVTSGESDPTL